MLKASSFTRGSLIERKLPTPRAWGFLSLLTLMMATLAAFTGPAAAGSTRVRIALPSPSAPLDGRGLARPVAAWVAMCEAAPTECGVDPGEATSVRLTPAVWQAILRVNGAVNARIKPRSDLDHWGVVDRWSYPDDGLGDCEDYQLLKRRVLAGQGLPRRAMRMTVVIDEKGEGHAVLTIRTDRGDFILDNKSNAVLPWHQTGYTFVKRESENGGTWVSLGGVTSPVFTANR